MLWLDYTWFDKESILIQEETADIVCETEKSTEDIEKTEREEVRNSNGITDGNNVIIYDVGEFCAVIYDDELYVGMMKKVNDKKHEYEIKFMEEIDTKEMSFRW